MIGSTRFPGAWSAFAATAAVLSAPASAWAQDDAVEAEFDRTPRSCITIARIRDTDILDDRTILFYMRGNKEVYRTYMPRTCPGLERNDRFSYRSHNGQLCDLDTITVLEQIGVGLSPSFTCRLGQFLPITREEAEDLQLAKEDGPGKRNAISAEPAELPPEGEAQEGDEADAEADGAAQETPDPAPAEQPQRRNQRGSGITSR